MTGYEILFDPFLPPWILGLAGGGVALAFAILIWRRIPGMLFRAGLAGLLLLGLANPILQQERRVPNKDVALLVVDETPSQTYAERLPETQAAAKELEDKAKALADGLDLRVVRIRQDSVQSGADGTRIAQAMRDALADVPARRFAGAIIVTDGQVHDADALKDLPNAPIHALISGRKNMQDRRLEVVEAPGFGVVDEPMTLVVRIDDPTAAPGDTLRPVLKLDGKPVRTGRIPLNQDVALGLTLTHSGPSIVEISVPVRADELTAVNNNAVLSINGVRDRLKVLLVSGEPQPGERVWRNLLKSDPSVDLVHFTILRPPEKQDGTPIDELSLIAFPTRELFEVKLHDFDLIVFDSYRRRGVLPSLYLANVVDYVRDGGALLDAAGPGYAGPFSLFRTPLADILPLEPLGSESEGHFIPTLTEKGLRHPVTAGLPGGPDRSAAARGPSWGGWWRQVDVIPDRGEVVMTGLHGDPLLVLDRVGEGRVAQIASDHIWLWARGYEGGGPHAELLRRLAHWLMKEPELEEEDLTAKVQGDRLQIERRTLQDLPDAPQATVTLPDGTQKTVTLAPLSPGRFDAVLSISQAGLYKVVQGDRSVLAAAGVLNSLELSDLVSTEAKLQPVADRTGGRVHWLADGGVPDLRRMRPGRPAAGSGWIGLRANGDYTVTGVDTENLIPGWLLILLAGGLLAFSWYREAQ